MSLLDNISKVATCSKYPPDKVVGVFEGSYDSAAADKIQDSFSTDVLSKHEIVHGFTRPVFTRLKWSKDGTTWLDGGFSQLPGDPNFIQCTTKSDSTKITLMSVSMVGIIYYKIIAIWIDDYDLTNPLVPAYASPHKPVAYDSRDNYQKLFMHGEFNMTGTSDTDTISHDLGYAPNAWIYFEALPGEVWLASASGTGNTYLYDYDYQGELDFEIDVDDIDLEWNAGFSFTGNARVWYRIYLDS